ncbi:hypothetical protein [Crenobacter luteus]|uniref:Motility protein n=1 Tax=Crenobacter luteus TaxID=1452487 RepID=A0A165F589_9NEIS|nr:hypothetical protein [Crenobacter luteus]KZE31249.1 hypothetical protein AVW16_12205 [Crenobacter luteus]
MEGITQAARPDVALAAQVYALKKAGEANAALLQALIGAGAEGARVATNKPPHLGQRIDVTA